MAAGGGRSGKSSPSKTAATTAKRQVPKPSRVNSRNRAPLGDHKHLTEELLGLLSSVQATASSFLIRNDLILRPSQLISLQCLMSSLTSYSPVSSNSFATSSSSWFHRFLRSVIFDGDLRWLECFCMSRPSFSHLLSLFHSSLLESIPTVPPDYALAGTLFRLAHGASYKCLSHLFGFESSGEACRVFYTVCKLINDRLGNLNELRSDMTRIIAGFGSISLPNCCGVLGFAKFEVEGEILGPNGSLLVQALVDSEGKFLDISAGWPGTLKPETVLYQTKLFSRVEESKELLNGPCCELDNGVLIPRYFVGDRRYPLLPWLLTPYPGSSPADEEEDSFCSARREFNSVHSRAMMLIDSAFSRIRERWQLLAKEWKQDSVEFFPFVIMTCCLLHNFLVQCGECVADNAAVPRSNDKHEDAVEFEGEVDLRAWRIRDSLADHVSRRECKG